MKVMVMSRARFSEFTNIAPRDGVISIVSSTGKKKHWPVCLAFWGNKLQLRFDDVTDSVTIDELELDAIRFTKDMAVQCWKFADKVMNVLGGDLVVHCDAGVSRSVAIGTCIAQEAGVELQLLELPPSDSWLGNPFVRSVMNRCLWEKHFGDVAERQTQET